MGADFEQIAADANDAMIDYRGRQTGRAKTPRAGSA
jgi:hypothetical protein